MDLNTVLLWLACISSGATFLRLLGTLVGRRRGRPSGWMLVSPAILATAGLCGWAWPNYAGFVAGALWALLVLVPMYVQRRVRQLAARQRFGRARRYALWGRWLHPWDGWFEQPDLLNALGLADRGELDEAVKILERLRISRYLGPTATVHLYRVRQQWAELVAWVRHFVGEVGAASDPAVLPMYLRALGEIGDVAGLVSAFDRAHRRGDAFLPTRPQCRLYLFAFCGQAEFVERLFDGPLAGLPAPVRQFWLATAEMAAGRGDAADARLREALPALPAEDAGLHRSIEYRLTHPPAEARPLLGPRSRLVLLDAEREHDQEFRYGESKGTLRPLATWALIALNVAVFGVELVRRASTDDAGLYRLGALYGPAVRAGQWWRVLAANFLHFGSVHLVMNMLALYVLGPFVEQVLGRAKYLLVYLLCGIASMTAVLGLQWIGWAKPELLVGASGAIMGMVGATAAILLRGWLRERALAASRRLQWVLTIVGLQVVFDTLTPQVSSTAHLAGTAFGFLLTFVLFRPTRPDDGAADRGFSPTMRTLPLVSQTVPVRPTPNLPDDLLPPADAADDPPNQVPRVLP